MIEITIDASHWNAPWDDPITRPIQAALFKLGEGGVHYKLPLGQYLCCQDGIARPN